MWVGGEGVLREVSTLRSAEAAAEDRSSASSVMALGFPFATQRRVLGDRRPDPFDDLFPIVFAPKRDVAKAAAPCCPARRHIPKSE